MLLKIRIIMGIFCTFFVFLGYILKVQENIKKVQKLGTKKLFLGSEKIYAILMPLPLELLSLRPWMKPPKISKVNTYSNLTSFVGNFTFSFCRILAKMVN